MSNKPTHPVKEAEVMVNAALYHLDEGNIGDAHELVGDALGTLQDYLEKTGFGFEGTPPPELVAVEKKLRSETRKKGAR